MKIRVYKGQMRAHRREHRTLRLLQLNWGTLVSVNWVCPEGLPDVHDRQRAFYTYGRGKNVVHECRGKLEHGLVRCTGSMYANNLVRIG